jgi:hypothetical protein
VLANGVALSARTRCGRSFSASRDLSAALLKKEVKKDVSNDAEKEAGRRPKNPRLDSRSRRDLEKPKAECRAAWQRTRAKKLILNDWQQPAHNANRH